MNKEVRNSAVIDATAENVWKVLTQSEYTKKYMYGCEMVTDWKVGSTLIWEMQHEGKTMIPVTGNIAEMEPNVKLKYSVIDPNAAYANIPGNHLYVTYLLEKTGNQTKFTVIQDGFEGVEDSDKRYHEISNNGLGWQPIVDQIKEISEQM